MPHGKFSVYVGRKSPEERAFWEAAEEYLHPPDHPRAGRIHWAEFVKYLARLVYEDRQKQTLPTGQSATDTDLLQMEVQTLRRQVDRMEQMLRRGELVARQAEPIDQVENRLAEKADRMAVIEW